MNPIKIEPAEISIDISREAYEQIKNKIREIEGLIPLKSLDFLPAFRRHIDDLKNKITRLAPLINCNIIDSDNLIVLPKIEKIFEGTLKLLQEDFNQTYKDNDPFDKNIKLIRSSLRSYKAATKILENLDLFRMVNQDKYKIINSIFNQFCKDTKLYNEVVTFHQVYKPIYDLLDSYQKEKIDQLEEMLIQNPVEEVKFIFARFKDLYCQFRLFMEEAPLSPISKRFEKIVYISNPAICHLQNPNSFKIHPNSQIGKGTFGSIERMIFGNEQKVIKTCFRNPDIASDIKNMRLGAAIVHNLGRSKYFARVEWITRNQLVMSEHSLNVHSLYKDHREFLIQKLPILAETMLGGLAVLHSHQYCIGDISTTNIILHAEPSIESIDNELYNFKFCDYDSFHPLGTPGCEGTYMFLPPEYFKKIKSTMIDPRKSNLWSIGMVLFLIMNEKWLSCGNFQEPHIKSTLLGLKQEDLSSQIDSFLKNENLIQLLGIHSTEQFFINYGLKEAQSNLIEVGLEEIKKSPQYKEYLKLEESGNEQKVKAFLYEFGINEFLKVNEKIHLKNFFVDLGSNKYEEIFGEKALNEKIHSEGEKTLQWLVDLTKKLLQMNPFERPSAEKLFDQFIVPLTANQDSTIPSDTTYSILEI